MKKNHDQWKHWMLALALSLLLTPVPAIAQQSDTLRMDKIKPVPQVKKINPVPQVRSRETEARKIVPKSPYRGTGSEQPPLDIHGTGTFHEIDRETNDILIGDLPMQMARNIRFFVGSRAYFSPPESFKNGLKVTYLKDDKTGRVVEVRRYVDVESLMPRGG